MSSSFGELEGLCHLRQSQVTPAFSSSGGKGGNGTVHEVKRSTTSLKSLERRHGQEGGSERNSRSHKGWPWRKHGRRPPPRKPSSSLTAPTLHPCRFLQKGGRSILKLAKAWSLCTASEVHSSTVQTAQCPSPSEDTESIQHTRDERTVLLWYGV